jgi:uncharacterized membrane protein
MPTFLSNTSFSLSGIEFWIGLILYFYLFAVIGWFVEMMYLSTSGRGLINSGFLQGPVCPAYAAGVLIIYPFTILFAPLPFWLQAVLYAGLATVVEYLAHFSLEKILRIRIWDYSDEFMNLHGRISLKYTIFWFLLVLFLVLVMQPAAITLIESLEPLTRYWLAGILGFVLIIDYILSAIMFSRMTSRVAKICEMYGLPPTEMQDLQFNRPRIMNEKKRLSKLLADPGYAALEADVSNKLFSGDKLDSLGFRYADFLDVINHPAYKAWKDASPDNTLTFNRYIRTAELAFAFCTAQGLDGTSAARGMLLAAYKSNQKGHVQRLIDFFLPQGRILYEVYKDIGPLKRRERDVLLHYTWPLNFGPPTTAECLMASFAEKIVNSREFRRVLKHLYSKALAQE